MELSPLTSRPGLFRTLLCLLVALFAFLAFRNTLDNYFSASDSLPLIQSNQLQSPGDLLPIFSQKMMAGTTFPGVFYRPVSVLSYQLDYLVWQLNPFGYHLTDLILHILVTIMTLLLGLELTRGQWKVSLGAALLFTSHPLLVETVPAIARRQDILEALLLVLSFYAYLKNRQADRSGPPVLSLIFFLLALGTKETAVQLPGLVFFHALFLSGNKTGGLSVRLKSALRTVSPFLVVGLLFLIWRFHVLGGLGEDGSDLSPQLITARFFTGLFYPQDFLHIQNSWGLAAQLGFLVLALSILGLLLASSELFPGPVPGNGLPLLLLAWLAIPLAILIVTGSFAYRSLDSSLIPFSLLVCLVISRSFRTLRERRTIGKQDWRPWAPRNLSSAVLLGTTCLLAASLAIYSPLVRDYPQWRQSGRVAQRLLDLLAENLDRFPPHAVINIEGLPVALASPASSALPRAHSVSFLRDYSIQSWLDLQARDKDLKVVVSGSQVLPVDPRYLDLHIDRVSPGAVDVKIVWPQP